MNVSESQVQMYAYFVQILSVHVETCQTINRHDQNSPPIRFVNDVTNQNADKVFMSNLLALHRHSQHKCHGLCIYQGQHGILRK